MAIESVSEEWRPVPRYEGLYEVSNRGGVRSVDRIDAAGRRLPGRPMCPCDVGIGYLVACLSRNGRSKNVQVHRMVAEAFIPNPGGKPQVNHLDGDRGNPAASNLEWCDQSGNQVHAYRTGLQRPVCGESHGACKLTDRQVRIIRAAHAMECGVMYLAKTFGVSHSHISEIVSGKKRLHALSAAIMAVQK